MTMTGGQADGLWIPYCGGAPGPAEWLARWNLDPLLIAALLALVAGWRVAGLHADPQRNLAFGTGVGLLMVLFVSPFCALTSALFAARTAHHALLVAAVAPLFALALPARHGGRAAAWTGLQAAVLWAWHYPPFYAAALASNAAYWLMQGSLLATALGFWASLRRASVTTGVAALLATMVQMGLLGALITFAGEPLYAPHLLTTAPWGLTPLEDQQLAGLIMWAPAAAAYLVAALLLAGRWLREEARSAA
jgi:putative membrane protein